VIEVMPDYHRGSHRAAGNWGNYPHNGAQRFVASEEEAERIAREDEDEYDHVVSGADPAEYPDWNGEVQS